MLEVEESLKRYREDVLVMCDWMEDHGVKVLLLNAMRSGDGVMVVPVGERFDWRDCEKSVIDLLVDCPFNSTAKTMFKYYVNRILFPFTFFANEISGYEFEPVRLGDRTVPSMAKLSGIVWKDV